MRRFGLSPSKSSELRLGQLAELADEASREIPDPKTGTETQSWIEYFYLQRRIEALLRLRLTKGDVVKRISYPDQLFCRRLDRCRR